MSFKYNSGVTHDFREFCFLLIITANNGLNMHVPWAGKFAYSRSRGWEGSV